MPIRSAKRPWFRRLHPWPHAINSENADDLEMLFMSEENCRAGGQAVTPRPPGDWMLWSHIVVSSQHAGTLSLSQKLVALEWGIEWPPVAWALLGSKGNTPSAQNDVWDHLCWQKPGNAFIELEDCQVECHCPEAVRATCLVRKRVWDMGCH